MKTYKYILEITVFVCGMIVMIFELVGSRVLGPFFGTSIFVWTNLIGIILGSLSLGYYFGGKIADKRPRFENLSMIILLAALIMGLTTITKDIWLSAMQDIFADFRIGSIFASLILFSPVSILLGMVSPYAVKLKMDNLNTSASTVGNLYAISTIGSIAGTFLCGFYLIPRFGTNTLMMILSVALFLTSAAISAEQFKKYKLLTLIIIIFCWFFVGKINPAILERLGYINFLDVDTPYNRVWIYTYSDAMTGKLTRVMGINNENHTSMFLDSEELVNEYAKYFNLAKHFNPDFKKTLMFGGAGYSYPKDFLSRYPDATIDVVEIDPAVTELAKKYFRLNENPRLTIHHEDGRVYLNKTQNKYDVIFGDAFASHYSLPYQMTTKEAIQKTYELLNDDGLTIVNIISSINGEAGKFLRAEYATYKNIFPQVYLFPVQAPNNGNKVQNIILVALKSEKEPDLSDINPEMNGYLQHLWKSVVVTDIPVLTDDFAPVDYYTNKAI